MAIFRKVRQVCIHASHSLPLISDITQSEYKINVNLSEASVSKYIHQKEQLV